MSSSFQPERAGELSEGRVKALLPAKNRIARVCCFIISMILVLTTVSPVMRASAADTVELAAFYANDSWYFSCADKDVQNPEPSIEVDENGNSYTKNFHMQYNVYLGEFDFSEGTPTQLKITYSAGYNVSPNWAQIYLVLGENENSIPTRWWAGPWNITSTGTWKYYRTLTVNVSPGGSLQWPKGRVKVWLHNSRVGMPNVKQDEIHVSSVKIVGTKNLPPGDGDGTSGDGESGVGDSETDKDNSGESGTSDPNDTKDKENNQGSGGNSSQNLQMEKDVGVNTSFSNRRPKPTTSGNPSKGSFSSSSIENAEKRKHSITLARIAIAGQQGSSTGSTGGGREEEMDEATVVLEKEEQQLHFNLVLLAVIILAVLGADCRLVVYLRSFSGKGDAKSKAGTPLLQKIKKVKTKRKNKVEE